MRTRKNSVIFRLALPVPINQLFDYVLPDDFAGQEFEPGCRVKVDFANRSRIGILVEISATSDIDADKLKTVCAILDRQTLFNVTDLKLLHWLSSYYHYPIGEVLINALPALLRQGESGQAKPELGYALTDAGTRQDSASLKKAPAQKLLLEKFQTASVTVSIPELNAWQKNWRVPLKALLAKQLIQTIELKSLPASTVISQQPLQLSAEQQDAVNQIQNSFDQFGVFLLAGVTGSGKTEVYMQLIAKVLARNQQVLVLVPEITLTPQLEQRFKQRFNSGIVISHSKLTDTQRLQTWQAMQTGTSSILLGTRSALFTVCNNLGLIILDEEHDSSFKQQERLRFSARDVAVMRAKLVNIPILLGSATPSLESLSNVEKQRYQLLSLTRRAGIATPPKFWILDIRNKRIQDGLSVQLLAEIKATLAKQEQVLIFINRRGFAPTLICHSCGWVAKCQRCDAKLVIYQDKNLLRCHHCQQQYALLAQCPACQKTELKPLGLGTERVEQLLARQFPDKKTVRLDTDSTKKKGSLEQYLDQINQGQVDIILGTQMLAKGHHFPNVTLVAILDIDSGLFSIDFRASERLAQLIEQVAGRAGRGGKAGKVVLQTRQPQHPLLTTLIEQGYQHFAQAALQERKAAGLPPYSYQALLRVQALNETAPQNFFTGLMPVLINYHPDVLVLGPVQAPMLKREGYYRYQILFQSTNRAALHQLLDFTIDTIAQLKEGKKIRWSLDVDPIDLY